MRSNTRKLCRSDRDALIFIQVHVITEQLKLNCNQLQSNHGENDSSSDEDPTRHPPVVCELLHQLLPVAAGTEVGLVEAPDVLDDFLSLHALPEGHGLSDISCNLGYIL